MTDRRRLNGPPGGTAPPVFASVLKGGDGLRNFRPLRSRGTRELRKICKWPSFHLCHLLPKINTPRLVLKTGLTPSASGSSYFEFQATQPSSTILPQSPNLKLICNVHGPKPLPRSAPFTPQLLLSTYVKFAPFASRNRRGWIRDGTERDLGAHLETALRGVIIGERWPKSGVDVIITIFEGEEDRWWGDELVGTTSGATSAGGWGLMTILAACITAASAALIDAGIDCVDIVAGGVASVVRNLDAKGTVDDDSESDKTIVLDPSPSEHKETLASCVVGYLPQRDEITELWMSGDAGLDPERLTDGAIDAARLTSTVLAETIKDLAKEKFAELPAPKIQAEEDIAMVG